MFIHTNHRKTLFSIVVIFVLLFSSLGNSLAPSTTVEKDSVKPGPSPTQAYQPAVEPRVVTVSREPIPSQIIVRFAHNSTQKERAAYIKSVGGTVVKNIDSLDTVVVNVSENIAS